MIPSDQGQSLMTTPLVPARTNKLVLMILIKKRKSTYRNRSNLNKRKSKSLRSSLNKMASKLRPIQGDTETRTSWNFTREPRTLLSPRKCSMNSRRLMSRS